MLINTLAENIIYFFLYSFVGWVCEVVYCGILDKKMVNRGFLFGPYCPIYGFGALIFVAFLLPLKYTPVLLFVVGMIACTVLEYITSWLMEKLFKLRWWDYSTYSFNINGRICLLNSVLFGIMGLFLVYLIHPFCTRLIMYIPAIYLNIVAATIIIVMSVDCFFSVLTLLDISQKIRQLEQNLVPLKQHLDQAKQHQLKIKQDLITLLSRQRNLPKGSKKLMLQLKLAEFKEKHLNKLRAISRPKDLERKHSPLAILSEYLQSKSMSKKTDTVEVETKKQELS